MKTKFTPGPWELKKTTARLEVAIPSNPRSSYAFSHIDGANAALITAAPEMYHDLHEAVVEMCFGCPSNLEGVDCLIENNKCFVHRWKNTLKKARGE